MATESIHIFVSQLNQILNLKIINNITQSLQSCITRVLWLFCSNIGFVPELFPFQRQISLSSVDNKFNSVLHNKMIANQNLPFQQDYFSNSQNLENLRTNINNLISNDIYTLESLLTVVENTLTQPPILPADQPHSQTLKKQKELQLFKYLSEQNRDRSDTVSGLAQLVIKMIDYIEEQHQKNQSLICGYLRKIDQLNDTISQVSYGKTRAENDNQILKEQLQYALIQIDKLIQEREYFNQNEVMNSELKEELHNFKIQLLQNQLNKLKKTLTVFKNSNQHMSTSIHFNQEPSTTLKYTYSLDNFSTPTKICNFCSEITNRKCNEDQDEVKLSHVKSDDKLSKNQGNSNRRNSRSPKKSGIRYLTENQISQQNIDQDQKIHFEQTQKDQLTLKKSRYWNNCFKKESFNEVQQLKINSNQDEPEQKHRLCSDFSQKSFICDFLPDVEVQPSRLIYISENEDQNKSNSSRRNFKFDFSNTTPSLETKQSDISMKHVEEGKVPERRIQGYRNNIKKSMYQSTIISSTPNKMKQSVLMKSSMIQPKQQQKGFFPALANFIVKNRVKRTTQKANSGMHKILI